MTDFQTIDLHRAAPPREAANTDGENPQKLFGICQAVGEAVGFRPIYLRAALLVLLMVSPIAMIATYAALGAFVLGSHILFPDVQAGAAAEMTDAAAADQAENVEERELLAA